MIHYLLQVFVLQSLFLLTYDLLLKKETFFNQNRLYLVSTLIASFFLPFIQFDFVSDRVSQEYLISLPAVILSDSVNYVVPLPELLLSFKGVNRLDIPYGTIIYYLWITGVGLQSVLLFKKFTSLNYLRRNNKITIVDKNKIVCLSHSNTAFSFLTTIYIGDQIEDEQRNTILLHEKAHIKEFHFIDLLLLELCKIVGWFNPLFYVYQSRLRALHEFIADAYVVKQINKKEYYQDLFSQVFKTTHISFINQFFSHSLIKKRIVMLQKSKSKRIFQLKYLSVIPLLVGIIFYSSCTKDVSEHDITSSPFPNKVEDLLSYLDSQEKLSEQDQVALDKLVKSLTATNGQSSKLQSKALEDEVLKNNVPFSSLDKAPVLAECSHLSGDEAKKCFSQTIQKLVSAQFNTEISKDMEPGVKRIYVRFKINQNGKVEDVRVRAPNAVLEEEASRVIKLLPEMRPGEVSGKSVNVLYSLPIILK
ncbi:M56 family metallopeptidase [Aquimarina sp. ERC-38]|uniref:M56 family metallopeptidase n=1 Tax=Aquimarina sp. ERC-38 TaxID=2949996 RepID=UPI00224858FD|nr:M56 family metallopeptidase [Aquimarina sp. ERC-38]UZO79941.1 M56 family metallopeptidase [Aquimarina sp. ERC-38]